MKSFVSKQRGFGVNETLIGFVLIAVIIIGVWMGQRTIQNARITNTVNDISYYQSQFQSYLQQYGAIPGDDADAPKRFSAIVSPTPVGDGDGILGGTFDSINPRDESRLLWADMRGAHLVRAAGVSEGSITNQPRNPFNGIYGFQNGAFGNTFSTVVLCLNKVPGSAAQAIDSKLDDGLSDSGNIQAIKSSGIVGEAISGMIAPEYDSSSIYTICIKM
jgi:hypothetical protein